MFGVDTTGAGIVRRIVSITNPARKRHGPVALSVNFNFLPPAAIEIQWHGKPVKTSSALDRMAAHIEAEAYRDLRGYDRRYLGARGSAAA